MSGIQTEHRNGRLTGLHHDEDPLEGDGSGLSAIAAARRYLDRFAASYGVPDSQLLTAGRRLEPRFQAAREDGLELRDASVAGRFSIVSFQQTHRGLPVWNHGVVVRMHGADNVISGSAANLAEDIDCKGADEPPDQRAEQADTAIAEVVAAAGLAEYSVTDTRDWVYRYAAEERLARDESDLPGAPDESAVPRPKLERVPRGVREGEFRYVTEVLFTTYDKEAGELNWRALVDWETNAVLYLRPLVADVSGLVFANDPISLSGNSELDPNAPVSLLNAQRELRTLERIALPSNPVALSGSLVTVQDVDAPNVAPPTEPGGGSAVFSYQADSDDFAAVCAYYTHDRLYRLVETLGFDLPTYFDGATFPVVVDHRWLNIVNAQAPGNGTGTGILRFRYSLADSGSTVGIATDPRVVAHEFGHGILWDHLFSPNFGFAHGLGDALAAVLFDPESEAPDRFRTFPFNNVILRRHDRAVASGWGWGGTRDVGSYPSTEIVATTMFRIYRSIGGDHSDVEERYHSSRYTVFLMLQAVPLLAAVIPNTTVGFCNALQESDRGAGTFEGFAAGWAHKVVRWGFEKQDLFGGMPPDVDVFIDDGRGGEYPFVEHLEAAPGLWNRHRPDGGTSHESPRLGVENYLYVQVSNRGTRPASGVKVRAFRAHSGKGRIWPDDWESLGDTASPDSVAAGGHIVAGPIPWCPEDPCGERIVASVSVRPDRSNVDTIGGRLPVRRLVLGDNNVALRHMDVTRPDEDRDCDGRDDMGHRYRYAVKFVCGCADCGGVVAPGSYCTAINVGNPAADGVEFRKRVSIALPGERAGTVSAESRNRLGAHEALEIDCDDIAHHARMPDGCFLKGFVVIESPLELDVTAVYTAGGHDGNVTTMDVETITPRRVRGKERPPRKPPEKEPEQPKLPDLVPVKPYPPGPPFFPSNYCESPKELKVIVRNQGEGAAGPTTTRVEFTRDDIVESRPTPALGPGDETTLSFPIPPGCVVETCPFRVMVNASAADGVTESDTTNNIDASSCGIVS